MTKRAKVVVITLLNGFGLLAIVLLFQALNYASDRFDARKAFRDEYRREAVDGDYFYIDEVIKTAENISVGLNYIVYRDNYQGVDLEVVYSDFDNDGSVDEYSVTVLDSAQKDGPRSGLTVVVINSIRVWESIYMYKSYRFNETVKYAGKVLQKKINEDYARLRLYGKEIQACKSTPSGSWYKEYPLKAKCE